MLTDITFTPTADQRDTLRFYERHGASLFPLLHGRKAPHGIVPSFKHDHSADPAAWQAWLTANPDCNFGVVAFASDWIIIDTDVGKAPSRDAAWAARLAKFAEWGLPADARPHVATPGQGWHDYTQLPPGVDGSKLIQPDAEKGIVQIRCVGYTVAAGSYFDGTPKGTAGSYYLLGDHPPHACTPALLAHVTPPAATAIRATGTYDIVGTRSLVAWMSEREAFADYHDWVAAGFALRAEFGDDGFDLWRLTFDETVDEDTAARKWRSFNAAPKAGGVTLASLMKRAHAMDWRGSVGKSTESMFGGAVAQLAAQSGAKLMGTTSPAINELGVPVLDRFLEQTLREPTAPWAHGYPLLPDANSTNGLPVFDLMQTALRRVFAMAEQIKGWKFTRVKDALAVCHAIDPSTCNAAVQWMRAAGVSINQNQLDLAIRMFESDVRQKAGGATFVMNARGFPDHDCTDNVPTLLDALDVYLRYNDFDARVEIAVSDGQWESISDHHVRALHGRAKSTLFNYHVTKSLLEDQMKVLARAASIDPLREHVSACRAAWDGVPRLDNWLSKACGVPNDPYHVAVGRNLIGGMVKRALSPGAKHDETVVLISSTQGVGKSSLCRALAGDDAWFTDSFTLEGSPQNYLPQLHGKWVLELSEIDGLSKRDANEMKRFFSTQTDNFTAKYEALAKDHPRRCIFVGTCNSSAPLQDITGDRRFLPVRVPGEINLRWVRANREQIVGEAATLFEQGERFGMPREIWSVAAEHQETARAISPVESWLSAWFENRTPSFIASVDLEHAFTLARVGATMRLLPPIMARLGWHPARFTIAELGWTQRRGWTNALPDGQPTGATFQPNGLARLHPTQSVIGRVEMVARLPIVANAPPIVPPPPY